MKNVVKFGQMNVYFIRHGQSSGNINNTHQSEDVRLSEEGKKQSKLLAVRLKDKKIGVIYASPYLRARQTAEIIGKELGLPIEYWERLRERRRPSEVEGLSYDHPKASEIYEITRKNQIKPNWRYSDDESFNDLLKRAKEVEKHILKRHTGQNVLCVSHIGILIMIVLQIILQDKLSPEVFWQFYYHSRQDNTGITHLEFTEKYGWKLLTWNDTTHL